MKKKLLSIALAMSIVLTLFSGISFVTSAFTQGYFGYNFGNGKAKITDVDKNISGNITVPSYLGGCLVTEIGEQAFEDCEKLQSITLPNSIEVIDDCAFAGCKALKSINFPNALTHIGADAFEDCFKLKSVVIPKKVENIGSAPFNGCSDLESIVVASGNPYFHSKNNCLIRTKYKDLVSGCKNSIIPADGSVVNIEPFAFCGINGLTSITIPSAVKTIDNFAFEDAFGLESVYISSAHVTLGAFHGCKSLKTVTLGSAVREIHQDAFGICPIKNVFYSGTASQRLQFMNIARGNESLVSAKWHYSSANCMHFPDVNYDDWYGKAVEYATYSGIMTGYANGKFGTADGIQRQDFVVILARISGDNINAYKGKKAFKDVDPNAYYAPALAWAKDKGVSNGYNDGSFGVGRKVTREQIMTFLHNYAKLKKYSTTVSTIGKKQILVQYPDFGNVSDFAKEATYWALSKGVISGKQVNGKRYISPGSSAQRCEVAAMFYNINKKGIFAK
ncbi:MAG TPA: hypothetical protein DEW35_00165 [Ruminococcaceae bacterium]|nr:hypothetical protein [Oscillospiraceae bacterium]